MASQQKRVRTNQTKRFVHHCPPRMHLTDVGGLNVIVIQRNKFRNCQQKSLLDVNLSNNHPTKLDLSTIDNTRPGQESHRQKKKWFNWYMYKKRWKNVLLIFLSAKGLRGGGQNLASWVFLLTLSLTQTLFSSRYKNQDNFHYSLRISWSGHTNEFPVRITWSTKHYFP